MTFNINSIPEKIRGEVNTIESFMKFFKVEKYEMHDDGVEINQDVRFFAILDSFPFKIKTMNGDLNLSNCLLTKLNNLPLVVDGNLNLNSNKLLNLDYCPTVFGNLSCDNNKQLTSISGLRDVIGNFSSIGCNIQNIDCFECKIIKGSMNLSCNSISVIKNGVSLNVEEDVILSENLIQNEEIFKSRIKAKHIDFSGNPCFASQEWESNCKVW